MPPQKRSASLTPAQRVPDKTASQHDCLHLELLPGYETPHDLRAERLAQEPARAIPALPAGFDPLGVIISDQESVRGLVNSHEAARGQQSRRKLATSVHPPCIPGR